MPYVQGSAIEKVYSGSIESKADELRKAISEHFGGDIMNIVAVNESHSYGFDPDGKFVKISYRLDGGKLHDVSVRPSKAVRVVQDEELPSFVAGQLGEMVRDMMKGKEPSRTQVREVASVISEDEYYWVSDLLAKIEESSQEDAEWNKMYEANRDQIRTSLYGSIRELEGKVPRTRYSKLPQGKLPDFVSEMRESIRFVVDSMQHVVDECESMMFDKGDEFMCAIRNSLIAEARTVCGLFGKAEKLMDVSTDLVSMSVAHDRLAERTKAMIVMSEYMRSRKRAEARSE